MSPSPGSPWTEKEIVAVRGQIQAVLSSPQDALFQVPAGPVSGFGGKNYTGEEIFHEFLPQDEGGRDEGGHMRDAVLPDVAKFVRLAFHDCIRDSNFEGCNGCLNFDQMGVLGPNGEDHGGCSKDQSCEQTHAKTTTDNNNLLWAARVLEEIYINKHPPFSDNEEYQLDKSLRDNGKSRADLWNFAGLIAIETAAEWHNNRCGVGTDLHKNSSLFCINQVDANSPPCNYTLPPITFKHGRKDCVPTCTGVDSFYEFCTLAVDDQPDPMGNGRTVTGYLKNVFDLTRKESIAIMGAHTLGHTNEQISGFRHYPWVPGGQRLLNNEFYKQMVDEKQYLRTEEMKGQFKSPQPCDKDQSLFLGDEKGNGWEVPKDAQWKVRSQYTNNDGGPWNWNLQMKKCNHMKCQNISQPYAQASCCNLLTDSNPYNVNCLKDPENVKCGKIFCKIEEAENGKCDNELLFAQRSYLNVDMGLYLDFDVDREGRPTGCPGFTEKWMENHQQLSDQPKCPLNKDLLEDGTTTMHEMVETYARDIQLWVNDFVKAFTKMTENGYIKYPNISSLNINAIL